MMRDLRSRARRRALASVMLVATLATTGCTQGTGARTDMTLDEAQKTTSAHMDALTAQIDPVLIESIDQVRDASIGCHESDVDPEQLVRQWVNRRYVWFLEEVSPLGGLDVLDELVTAHIADGWKVTRDKPDGDGRRVLMYAPDSDGHQSDYGIEIGGGGGGEAGRLTSLNIMSFSPCFEASESAARS